MIIPPDILINMKLHPEDQKILDDLERSEKIIFDENSLFDRVMVTENQIGRFLKFGDSYQAGIIDYAGYKGSFPYINYFFISLLLKPEIKDILILGMGTGEIATRFASNDNVKLVDIVEIDPLIPEVDEKHLGFYRNKKININIQDARVYVRNCKKKYDLVILDVFSQLGMPYRFMTVEFLEEVKCILTKNGIMAVNTFAAEDFESERNVIFKAQLKSFQKVFGNILLFPTVYGNYELYRQIFGLKHDIPDLTNVTLFASDSALFLNNHHQSPTGVKEKYLDDLYAEDLTIRKIKALYDKYEQDPEFTIQNLVSYLTSRD